jgi:hypothetical protein
MVISRRNTQFTDATKQNPLLRRTRPAGQRARGFLPCQIKSPHFPRVFSDKSSTARPRSTSLMYG